MSNSSFRPVPFRAETSSTGQPSSLDIFTASILSPFFFTTSIMFRAMTTGMPISMTWVVRYRLRSRLVASTRLTITSGCSSMM